jgi:hypothetical protein
LRMPWRNSCSSRKHRSVRAPPSLCLALTRHLERKGGRAVNCSEAPLSGCFSSSMMHTSCYGPALCERDRHLAKLTADATGRVRASSLATAEGMPRGKLHSAARDWAGGKRGKGGKGNGGGNCLEVEHAIAVEVDPAQHFLQLFSHAVPIPHPPRLCCILPVPWGPRNLICSWYQFRPRDYILYQDFHFCIRECLP